MFTSTYRLAPQQQGKGVLYPEIIITQKGIKVSLESTVSLEIKIPKGIKKEKVAEYLSAVGKFTEISSGACQTHEEVVGLAYLTDPNNKSGYLDVPIEKAFSHYNEIEMRAVLSRVLFWKYARIFEKFLDNLVKRGDKLVQSQIHQNDEEGREAAKKSYSQEEIKKFMEQVYEKPDKGDMN